jgi:hypothetical protein
MSCLIFEIRQASKISAKEIKPAQRKKNERTRDQKIQSLHTTVPSISPQAGNTKGGSITVLLTSRLTDLD